MVIMNNNSYNTIINPKTGRKVSTLGNKGKNIIQNYVNRLMRFNYYGGSESKDGSSNKITNNTSCMFGMPSESGIIDYNKLELFAHF